MDDPAGDIRTYHASDGYRLHYRLWQPGGGKGDSPLLPERPEGCFAQKGTVPFSSTPHARIVALHGIQSHSGWFPASSAQLAEAGFEVRFLDRRGSGLNAIERGHAAHHERLVNDVVQMLVAARAEEPKRPVILMGVSWGGKLAAAVAAKRPDLVSALALLYPGMYPKIGPSLGQRLALALARKTPVGKWNTVSHRAAPIPLDDPALFTANPQRQKFVADDPLALRHVTVGFLLASRELDRQAHAAPGRLEMPVLVMLAGRDRIINNRATRRWFARLPRPERSRLIEYPEAQHTLEFEPDPEPFLSDLVGWMEGVVSRGR